MRPLNPRQIEAFRALMLTGGATDAAKLMGVTQPAVSRMIRDLQLALDLKLFERRGTRLVPTGEARGLYAEVERSFLGLDRIATAAAELRTRRAGILRIASLPALANGFLPRFVGQFLAERPKLDLMLSGLVSHIVIDLVASGQCDLGFAQSPIEHSGVTIDKMPNTAYVAVLPPGHPLTRKTRLRPADFADESFISLGHSTAGRYRIDEIFAQHNVNRVMRIETPLSEIACALTVSGAGVSLVEPFTAREYSARGLVVRPFSPRIDFEFAALYPSQRSLPAVAREFIDSFRHYIQDFARRQSAGWKQRPG
jgi:DNA-binding transcriptional LysR family regulator